MKIDVSIDTHNWSELLSNWTGLPPHKVYSPVCKGGVAVLVGFMVEWQVAQGRKLSTALPGERR